METNGIPDYSRLGLILDESAAFDQEVTYFDLSQSELKECDRLLHEAKEKIQLTDSAVAGFQYRHKRR